MIDADGTFPIYDQVANWWDWFTYEDIAGSMNLQSQTRVTIELLAQLLEAIENAEDPDGAQERKERKLEAHIVNCERSIQMAEMQLAILRGESF